MSAAFAVDILKVKEDLFAGRLDSASMILDSIDPSQSFEHRWVEHYKAIIHMRQGRYHEAKVILLNALSRYGYHISVVLDLAACYYMCGQIFDWMRIVRLAQYEFAQSQNYLDHERRLKSKLLLAKFLEESGAIKQSLTHYKEIADQRHSVVSLMPVEVKAAAQIVRICAQYKLSSEMVIASECYADLIRHSAKSTHLDCDFEVLHALMLYEIQFIDIDVALNRYIKLKEHALASAGEMQWIKEDLIYELTVRGEKRRALEILSTIDIKSCGKLTELCSGLLKSNYLSYSEYDEALQVLTPAAHARLLKLMSLFNHDRLLSQRQKMFVDSVSKDDRPHWSNYIGLHSVQNTLSEDVILILDQKFLSLPNENTKIELSPNTLELLNLFRTKGDSEKQMSSEEAISKLWNGNANENDLARLRMRVSRINSLILSEFGLKKFLRLDKFGLNLSYVIKFNS